MSRLRVLSLLVFRLTAIFLVRTWFAPDEHFQAIEPAHKLVYGSGELTWEWRTGLRSYLHPALVAVPYYLLQLLGLDSQWAVAFVPRALHAIIFAFGDDAFCRLSERLLDPRAARWAQMCYLSNWFVFYCSSRTLANSLETALMLIAMTRYPWSGGSTRSGYVPIAVASIFIRPTAALVWLVLGAAHAMECLKKGAGCLARLLFGVTVSASLTVAAILTLDYMFYGRFVFALWTFLEFNVLSGQSALFGVHPWWWYLGDGLPSVLGPQVVCLLFLFRHRPRQLIVLSVAVFYVFVHSCLGHKEHRFLLPVVPILALLIGEASGHSTWLRRLIKWSVPLSAAVALYTGLLHQAGPYAAANAMIEGGGRSGIALMPCYSLPGEAFFHGEMRLRQLDCSPGSGEMDEADVFHDDPDAFVEGLLKKGEMDVDYVLAYEKTWHRVERTLRERKVWRKVFHAHFPVSSRQDHYIVIARRL